MRLKSTKCLSRESPKNSVTRLSHILNAHMYQLMEFQLNGVLSYEGFVDIGAQRRPPSEKIESLEGEGGKSLLEDCHYCCLNEQFRR